MNKDIFRAVIKFEGFEFFLQYQPKMKKAKLFNGAMKVEVSLIDVTLRVWVYRSIDSGRKLAIFLGSTFPVTLIMIV